jgi:hypothetical protein
VTIQSRYYKSLINKRINWIIKLLHSFYNRQGFTLLAGVGIRVLDTWGVSIQNLDTRGTCIRSLETRSVASAASVYRSLGYLYYLDFFFYLGCPQKLDTIWPSPYFGYYFSVFKFWIHFSVFKFWRLFDCIQVLEPNLVFQ